MLDASATIAAPPRAPSAAVPPRSLRAVREGWRYRANIAARALAATLGAYGVAALFAFAGARLTPLPRLDAILPATMLALLLWPLIAIGVFLARSALRAWAGLALAAALLALAAWGAGPPA